jgi:hypothetical protein
MHSLLYNPAPSVGSIVAFTALTLAVVAAAAVAIGRVHGDHDHDGNDHDHDGNGDGDGNEATASAKRRRKAGLILLAWLGLTTALAASGVLAIFSTLPSPARHSHSRPWAQCWPKDCR